MASVTKTTTSKGEVRYRVRYRDPEGKSREKTYKRKADADRKARNIETDKDRHEYIDPKAGEISVAAWVNQHEATKLHRRPSTIVRDRGLIDRNVLPAFGARQIKSLQPVEVRAWVGELSASGLAADTVRKAHQLLNAALEAAVDDGLIPSNPARRVDLPQIVRQEMRFLAPDEIDQLVEAINPRHRALVLTAVHTGLRFGELAGLHVPRLDMLRRTLRVEEALTEVQGRLHFGPPKTSASRRTVTMPKTLVEVLAEHLATHPASSDGLVFTVPGGGPLRNANFRHRIWTPAVIASVGQPLRFHDLRHTHTALLVAADQHPKVIQERLGHASIKTTLDTYGHLFEGLDQAAADALDDLWTHRAVGFSWG